MADTITESQGREIISLLKQILNEVQRLDGINDALEYIHTTAEQIRQDVASIESSKDED